MTFRAERGEGRRRRLSELSRSSSDLGDLPPIMSTPGAPVSKSQLKKQAKAAAAAAASAATEGPATPTGDGDAAASSSIQPTEAETAAAGGAGSAVVGKRIKQLAKRVVSRFSSGWAPG